MIYNNKMTKLLVITVLLGLALADQAMLRAPAEFAQVSTETTTETANACNDATGVCQSGCDLLPYDDWCLSDCHSEWVTCMGYATFVQVSTEATAEVSTTGKTSDSECEQ